MQGICRRRFSAGVFAVGRSVALICLAAAWAGLCADLRNAQATTFSSFTVDSKSNIYLAGLSVVPAGGHPNGEGILPPSVSLPVGANRVLRFLSVSGSVSFNNVDAPSAYIGQFNGPDGGAVEFADANFPSQFLTTATPPGLISPADGSPTTFYMAMDSYGGISGMNLFESIPADRRVMFLSGVFIADSEPVAPAPASLDFSSTSLGRSFTELSPLLYQTFYIGDGRTGDGSGDVQTFIVPTGATRLFLGIVDGSYFVGGPDYYDNNDGSFVASFAVNAVPEINPASFSSAMSLLVGAIAFLEQRRQRLSRIAS